MELSNLDITISRIREIETRISHIDNKMGTMLGVNNTGTKSFNKVLDEKIKEAEKPVSKKDDSSIEKLIEKYSKENNLNKDLVNAVIKTESNYDTEAVSRAGAQGLMQLMPLTAQSLGVNDPFDPEQNIAGGTKYLRNLINRYNSVELGLAAYNAGPNTVNKYGGVPPYEETRNYVKKVLELQGGY